MSTQKITHHIFGNIYSHDTGVTGWTISLRSIRDAASYLNVVGFTSAIKDLSEQLGQKYILATDSAPDFDLSPILESLPIEKIGGACVSKRDDLNSALKDTLSLRLHFDDVVLELAGEWSPYKSLRVTEMMEGFILPMARFGYFKKGGFYENKDGYIDFEPYGKSATVIFDQLGNFLRDTPRHHLESNAEYDSLIKTFQDSLNGQG